MPRLSRVWAVLKLIKPDGSKRTLERDLARRLKGQDITDQIADFDLRAQFVSSFDMLASGSRIGSEYLEQRYLEHFLANRSVLFLALAQDYGQAMSNQEVVLNERLSTYPFDLLEFLYTRALLMESLGATNFSGLSVFVGEPQVIALRQNVDLGPDQVPRFHVRLDIMSNAIQALEPEIGNSRKDRPALFRSQQGVIDTLLEYLMLGGEDVVNAHSVLARAIQTSTKLKVIVPGDWASFDEVAADEPTRTALKRDLDDGYVVVAPIMPVMLDRTDAFAWWRIHTLTGETLGMSGFREGQAITERVILELPRMAATTAILCIGLQFFGFNKPGVSGYSECVVVGTLLGAGGMGAALKFGLGGAAGFLGAVCALQKVLFQFQPSLPTSEEMGKCLAMGVILAAVGTPIYRGVSRVVPGATPSMWSTPPKTGGGPAEVASGKTPAGPANSPATAPTLPAATPTSLGATRTPGAAPAASPGGPARVPATAATPPAATPTSPGATHPPGTAPATSPVGRPTEPAGSQTAEPTIRPTESSHAPTAQLRDLVETIRKDPRVGGSKGDCEWAAALLENELGPGAERAAFSCRGPAGIGNVDHWFARYGDRVLDPTAAQYIKPGLLTEAQVRAAGLTEPVESGVFTTEQHQVFRSLIEASVRPPRSKPPSGVPSERRPTEVPERPATQDPDHPAIESVPESSTGRSRDLAEKRARSREERDAKHREDRLRELMESRAARRNFDKLPDAERQQINNNKRLRELSFDPDRKTYDIREGDAGLQAEKEGTLRGPITRDFDPSTGQSRGAEFADADGLLWDHLSATKGSPGGSRQALPPNEVADAVLGKAAPPRQGEYGENVLVDLRDLTPAQQKAVVDAISAKPHPQGAGQIRFVPKR